MKRKVLIGLVVVGGVALGCAYYIGWFRWPPVTRETVSDLRTKAQIKEAQILAKAKQLTSDSTVGSLEAAQVCRQNLRWIETAKRTVAQRYSLTAGPISYDAVVRELGGQIPRCPAGGEYTLNAVEMLPRCSIGANGTTESQDDHILQVF